MTNFLIKTHLRRAAFTSIAAIGVIVVLAGCNGTNDARPTPSSSFAGLQPGVIQATNVPTSVPNSPDRRKDVTVESCNKNSDSATAAGKVKNSTGKAADYTITIFFTTGGGTVIGTGNTKVDVGANETKDWSINQNLTPADPTNCVLRGVG